MMKLPTTKRPVILSPDDVDYLIKNAPPCSEPILATFPPETSQHVIAKHNKGNRPLKTRKIKEYGEMMMTPDKWKVNNASVGFSRRRLFDGQNRFVASATTNAAFTTWAFFGIEDDSFDTVDVGAPRDHADIVKLEGSKEARVAAVAVRWVMWIQANQANVRKPAFNPQQTGQLYLKHKRIEDFVPQAKRIAGKSGGLQSPGVVAAFLYCFDGINSDLASDFADAWETIEKRVDAFVGIRMMTDQISILRGEGIKGSDLMQNCRAAMIINAWKYAVQFTETGKASVTIRWRPSEGKPFPLLYPPSKVG